MAVRGSTALRDIPRGALPSGRSRGACCTAAPAPRWPLARRGIAARLSLIHISEPTRLALI
eukprot:12734837-Alexandrium_andersonii.AAC.1